MPQTSGRKVAIYAGLVLAALAAGATGRTLVWRAVANAVEPAPTTGRAGGSLLICGGGKIPDEVKNRFVELAGGPRAKIVVIPTAHTAADSPEADRIYLAPWRNRGAASVTMLHTRSRDKVEDPEFLRPLKEATAVWIGGGKQSVLAATYGETEVERQLKRLLARGGVIGGSSAGAAIMTRVMIQSGRTEATIGRGFDLLADAVVDQHFLKRKRDKRLLGLLSKHPGLLGFGIDERTALLVQGNRLSVLGDSYVVACLPASEDHPPKMEFLRRGDEADLASLRTSSPHIVATMDLDGLMATEE